MAREPAIGRGTPLPPRITVPRKKVSPAPSPPSGNGDGVIAPTPREAPILGGEQSVHVPGVGWVPVSKEAEVRRELAKAPETRIEFAPGRKIVPVRESIFIPGRGWVPFAKLELVKGPMDEERKLISQIRKEKQVIIHKPGELPKVPTDVKRLKEQLEEGKRLKRAEEAQRVSVVRLPTKEEFRGAEFERKSKEFRSVAIAKAVSEPFIRTGQFVKALFFDPIETGRQIDEMIRHPIITFREAGKGIGKFLRVEPPEVIIARGVGEAATAKLLGTGFEKGRRGAAVVRTRVSPKFKKIDLLAEDLAGKIAKDTEVALQEAKGFRLTRTEPVGVIKKVPRGKEFIDVFIERSPFPSEPFKRQALLGGLETEIVTAQRSFFKNILDRSKKVFKEGQKGIDETLFASPEARLRVSRLPGAQPEAKLLDILSGDITFTREQAQALLFGKRKIAIPPKGSLASKAFEKLKKGRALSTLEADAFLRWQLTPTGEFKPIGRVGTEVEVVLAPGEVVVRKRLAARTLVEGEPLALIEVDIAKVTAKRTKELLKKARLSELEILELDRRLLKETGDVSRVLPSKPLVPVGRVSAVATSKLLSSIEKDMRSALSAISPSRKEISGPSASSLMSDIQRSISVGRPSRPVSRKPSPRVARDRIARVPSVVRGQSASSLMSEIRRSIVSPRPPVVTPLPKVVPVPELRKKKKKEKKSLVAKIREDLFFIQDFSSRALDINVKLTEKQLGKLLRKPLTGLELRPGIQIVRAKRKKKRKIKRR